MIRTQPGRALGPAPRRTAAVRSVRIAASLLVAALALLPSTACVSSAGPRDTGGWLAARGADLMDVVGVRLAFGTGLGVYARITRFLQFGFMMRGPEEQDLPRPQESGVRGVPCLMVGTIGRYGGLWTENTREFMLPGWSSRDTDLFAVNRQVIAGYVGQHGREDLWQYSVGVGAHLVLFGVEVEVRPFQVFDFLSGLVGYDPSSDDVPVLADESSES
ncbi:MAG: hypothetical protein H6825_00085 [Planctomycetes bacterium]|nr:hypothetical protein [Planctomycetota bacterium]